MTLNNLLTIENMSHTSPFHQVTDYNTSLDHQDVLHLPNLNKSLTASFFSLKDISSQESQQRLPAIIYLWVLIIIGVLGNTAIVLIYIFKYQKSNFRVYVLCLAFLDLTACCIAMPAELVDNQMAYMFYSTSFCKTARFCAYFSKIGSALVISIMAVDRHKKVCHPFNKRYCPCAPTTNCCIGLTLTLVLAIPKIAFSGIKIVRFPGNVTGYDCTVDEAYVDSYLPFIYIIIQTVIFLVSFATLLVLYTLIAVALHKQSQKPTNEGSLRKKMIQQRSKNVTKLMTAISVSLVLSYLPHFILTSITAFNRTDKLLPPTPLVLGTLPILSRSYFINNVINPFIYFFGDKQFRDAICRYFPTVSCKKHQHRVMSIELVNREISHTALGKVNNTSIETA